MDQSDEEFFVLSKDRWRYTRDKYWAVGDTKQEAIDNWRDPKKRKEIAEPRSNRR